MQAMIITFADVVNVVAPFLLSLSGTRKRTQKQKKTKIFQR
jgi:hypothetical protein